MAGAMEEFRDTAAQAKKTLVHEPCGGLPHINADRELIVRVIENLLTNAIRFTREGGKVTLSASHDMTRGTVKVCVSDEGQGIPAELRERVFDKFFQVEASGMITVCRRPLPGAPTRRSKHSSSWALTPSWGVWLNACCPRFRCVVLRSG